MIFFTEKPQSYRRNLCHTPIDHDPCIHTYNDTYLHTTPHTHAHTSTNMHVHAHAYTHTHAYTHAHTHLRTHARTHARRFTQICMNACRCTHAPFSFKFCFDNI